MNVYYITTVFLYVSSVFVSCEERPRHKRELISLHLDKPYSSWTPHDELLLKILNLVLGDNAKYGLSRHDRAPPLPRLGRMIGQYLDDLDTDNWLNKVSRVKRSADDTDSKTEQPRRGLAPLPRLGIRTVGDYSNAGRSAPWPRLGLLRDRRISSSPLVRYDQYDDDSESVINKRLPRIGRYAEEQTRAAPMPRLEEEKEKKKERTDVDDRSVKMVKRAAPMPRLGEEKRRLLPDAEEVVDSSSALVPPDATFKKISVHSVLHQRAAPMPRSGVEKEKRLPDEKHEDLANKRRFNAIENLIQETNAVDTRAAPMPRLGRAAPMPRLGRAAPMPRLGRAAPMPRLGRAAPMPRLGKRKESRLLAWGSFVPVNSRAAPMPRLGKRKMKRLSSFDRDIDGLQTSIDNEIVEHLLKEYEQKRVAPMPRLGFLDKRLPRIGKRAAPMPRLGRSDESDFDSFEDMEDFTEENSDWMDSFSNRQRARAAPVPRLG